MSGANVSPIGRNNQIMSREAMPRAVVTGIGAITPIGCTAPEFTDSIFSVRTGFSPITRNSMDGYSASDPHPEGRGALAAMRSALASAGKSPSGISAVSAHGTSTPKNDPAECAAILGLFGPRAPEVPVFATKSMIGHLISAAGAVEVIAAIQCLRRQELHPTANLADPAEECQLNHVVGRPRVVRLEHILKNSFAFGGQNACLVVSRA